MAYEFIMREKLGFYFVENNYVNYLKSHDKNVCDNYDGTRPYIGILIEVNKHKYIAPLTSPGKLYLQLNRKYKRIVHAIEKGKLGYVRIGNMIPVTDNVISPVIISEIDDEYYKDVLLDEYKYLRKDMVIKEIREQANHLYKIRTNNDNHYLASIMCDFTLLEQLSDEYENRK